MGNYTTNLGLYNTDMATDGNDTFDFKRDINDNNDIIDSAIGKLSTLTTTDKSSLVNAIIEIVSSLGGKASVDLDNLSSLGQAIMDKKVEVEALLQQNGYAKFSWKENNQISNLIIQWGACIAPINITLPIIFNSNYSVVAMARTDYPSAKNYISEVNEDTEHSLTGFKLGTSTNNQTSIYWFAVGY